MIIVTVVSVTKELINKDYYLILSNKVVPILFSFVGVGLGGFQATIIQFGLDQLYDASTVEIKSYILWYAMTNIGSFFVINFSIWCLNDYYKLLLLFYVCMSLTLAVIVLKFCNHWLIKEPATKNPFKLICNVIKYAIKNKHPRCKSAFTYCEDDLPSRIDFGKNKYGGPFTTEQVEDVKTFLRILPLITLISIGASIVYATNNLHMYLAIGQTITDMDKKNWELRNTLLNVTLIPPYHN